MKSTTKGQAAKAIAAEIYATIAADADKLTPSQAQAIVQSLAQAKETIDAAAPSKIRQRGLREQAAQEAARTARHQTQKETPR